jgi:hypothetical protein
MNKEQLGPIVAEENRWFTSQTCPMAEWYWAQFLLNEFTLQRKLEPEYSTIITTRSETYDAWTITKNFKPSQPTKLIIDPFPGIIVSLSDRIIRPILVHPILASLPIENLKIAFASQLKVDTKSSSWFMDGMTQLLTTCVAHPIDAKDLQQTMQTFQKKFNPRFP